MHCFPSPIFAKGAVLSGGSASYGPERVANGTFAADTASWSPQYGGTLSLSAGQLKITTSAGGGAAQQVVTGLTPGSMYRFTGEMAPHQLDRASIGLGNAATINLHYGTTGSPVDVSFTAASTDLIVTLYAANNGTWADAGDYALFDNLSLKEIL
jgi:hypothetical protein